MTGIEMLREELLKKGYTKQQIGSQVVFGVLEVVAGNSIYTEQAHLLAEIDELNKQIAGLQATADMLKTYIDIKTNYVDECVERAFHEQTELIKTFLDALKSAETPEARDAIRVAQTYINAVDVDTKYDNTAFIIGLAQILSVWNTAAIDTLHKINPKIGPVKVPLPVTRTRCGYEDQSIEYHVMEKTDGSQRIVKGRRI